jgi:hypothetical protein
MQPSDVPVTDHPTISDDRPNPTGRFDTSDFARARVLISKGRHQSEDLALALGFLRRLLPYAELLQAQRTALRVAMRAMIVERDGRLCYFLGDDSLVPMPIGTEQAVRAALASVRPSAAAARS